jgi:hypothetical protein
VLAVEKKMEQTNSPSYVKPIVIASAITFIMLATRGSHMLTNVSLPDASLALFLVGGLLLRRAAWFVFFVVPATVIDFSAAAVDSWFGFCLTAGYWGMLPTYAVMWLAGVWLAKQSDSLSVPKFTLAALLATFAAFVISTQTYYLFSGRFPNTGLQETLQYGWNYLPSYMSYTAAYLLAFWVSAKTLPKLEQLINSVKTA